MLLGINGVVVKAHGNSDIEGFTGALNVARRMVDNNIVSKIRGLISENE
jgi:glycerol-3-phosphate acyltransferase PlsX